MRQRFSFNLIRMVRAAPVSSACSCGPSWGLAARLQGWKEKLLAGPCGMAWPFWVTDFLVWGEMEIDVYLKLMHPVGALPLTFHISRCTLVHGVASSQCSSCVLLRQFVHGSLLERSSFWPHGAHLKLMNAAFQNLFSHHCAQGEPEHHQALRAHQLQPLLPGLGLADDSIQAAVGASRGMTKRLPQTFPRQELTVGHG